MVNVTLSPYFSNAVVWSDRQIDRQIFQLSYQNKSCSECQQDVKTSVRQTGRYTVRQADRVTERQNDSMTVWQNSRAAKEPALVYFLLNPLNGAGFDLIPIYSPWKVGIGATWRTRQSHRELQEDQSDATKSVAINQNSQCDWRTSPARTGDIPPNSNFARTDTYLQLLIDSQKKYTFTIEILSSWDVSLGMVC